MAMKRRESSEEVQNRKRRCLLTSTSVVLEDDDISILHDVILTLGVDLTSSTNSSFRASLLKVSVRDNFSANKLLLEIGVDGTSGLRSLHTSVDGPGANLRLTDSEERHETETRVTHLDDTGQHGASLVLSAVGGSLLGGHIEELVLELSREGDDGVTRVAGLNPPLQRGKRQNAIETAIEELEQMFEL